MHFFKEKGYSLKKISLSRIVSSRIFLLCVVGLLFLGTYLLNRFQLGDSPFYLPSTYATGRGSLDVRLFESGRIKSRYFNEVRNEMGDEAAIISILSHGTLITPEQVKKGAAIVELDATALQDKLADEKIFLDEERENIREVESALKMQSFRQKSRIKWYEKKRALTAMALERYVGSALADEIISQGHSVSYHEDHSLKDRRLNDTSGKRGVEKKTLDTARWIFHPMLEGIALFEKQALERSFDLAKRRMVQADNWLDHLRKEGGKSAEHILKLKKQTLFLTEKQIAFEDVSERKKVFFQYGFKEALERLEMAHWRAVETVEGAKLKMAMIRDEGNERLKLARRRFNQRKKRYEALLNRIEKSTFRPFQTGLFITGSEKAFRLQNEIILGVGDIIAPNQPIFTILDLSCLVVEVKIPEYRIREVNPGQSVMVRPDALPEKAIMGRVDQLSPIPDSSKKCAYPGERVYAIEITLDENPDFLKPGMTVSVEIVTHRLSNVLMVPIQAVFQEKGRSFSYVIDRRKISKRPVITGKFNEEMIHIKKGLKEKEAVLLYAP